MICQEMAVGHWEACLQYASIVVCTGHHQQQEKATKKAKEGKKKVDEAADDEVLHDGKHNIGQSCPRHSSRHLTFSAGVCTLEAEGCVPFFFTAFLGSPQGESPATGATGNIEMTGF